MNGTDIKTEKRDTQRKALTEALIKATRPEKTGTWSWDGFMWDEKLPILHIMGDHGTPDFTLTFCEGGAVIVSPDSNPSWATKLNSTYTDYDKLAADIIATTVVIDLRGSIR